ncbi:hypothetical protein KHA80_22325 [Anaerobacillus sp. HL2]|nr:hypothetical protein KHA80_22325 [Anaerobacillus sp. HL2]
MYEDYRKEETERTNYERNSLIKSLGWIVIPLPIFIYFTRRLRQAVIVLLFTVILPS